METYTPDSICLDKGKYFLKPFRVIPVAFLLRMYFTNQPGEIFNYAKQHLDELLDKAKTTYVPPVAEMEDPKDCAKIKYMNKTVANAEMRRIQSHITHDYKPVRSYYCEACSCWHLTSKSNYELEKYERNTGLTK